MKKMNLKMLVLGSAVILSSAFAKADGGNRKLSDQELENTKKAVSIALEGKTIHCDTTNNNIEDANANSALKSSLSHVDSGILSNGNQPLITLVQSRNDGSMYEQLLITTSADYQQVISVVIKDFSLQEVNNGNLMNPQLGLANIVSYQANCTIRN